MWHTMLSRSAAVTPLMRGRRHRDGDAMVMQVSYQAFGAGEQRGRGKEDVQDLSGAGWEQTSK